MRSALIIAAIAAAGCGRVGFDALADAPGAFDVGETANSCIGLALTCGPTGASDCCESPVVPGGTYLRSYDASGDMMYNDPTDAATVSDFRLDKYEVTVGRFRQFVDAGMGTQLNPPAPGAGAHATIPGSGWDLAWNLSLPADTAALVTEVSCPAGVNTYTASPGGNESRPVNCVSYFEAMAFCAWDGGFVPSEAEWDYAAAGGSEQRAYPWSVPSGDLTIDNTHASYALMTNVDCIGDGNNACGVTDMLPVGSKPAGDARWGQSDMGGNVWEWVLDWYATPYQTPCFDCALLTEVGETFRVVRGGAFNAAPSLVRTAYRSINTPLPASNVVGLRCARPL